MKRTAAAIVTVAAVAAVWFGTRERKVRLDGMGITLNGSNQYLEVDNALGLTYPYSVAAWVKTTNSTLLMGVLHVCDKDAPNHGDFMQLDGSTAGDPAKARSVAGGSGVGPSTSTGYAADGSWQHVLCVFASSTDRRVYLNGGGKGTDTASASPVGRDRISIGRFGDSTPSNYFAGSVAYVTFWSSALTDGNAASLAGGADPESVAPGSLVENWPLADNTDLTGTIASTVLTAFNSPTSSGDGPTISGGSPTIGITSPVQYQAKQRDGSGQADIDVSGIYTGDDPSDSEYRLTPASTATPGSWIAASATVGSNVYSFTISDLDADDYLIEVRNADDTGVTDSVDNVLIGDVFLWIGQSNRSGRFTNGQTFGGSVTCSVYDEAGAWSNLGSNYKDPDEIIYSVLPLLATLISDDTGVPCSFVCQTTGGTGLLSPQADWAPGGSGAQYNAAVARVAASEVNTFKAILWNQGETDAKNDIETAAYAAAESAMLDALQAADSALSGVKMISDNLGGDNSSVDSTEDQSKIQQAKIYNWENDSDILPGSTGHDQDFSDDLHWKSDAQAVILAARLWRAIKAASFSGTEDPRGPRFSSATFSDDTITLNLTGGETPIANGTDYTGWAVADDNGARTVSSVSISGRTVTIVCDQALAAPVTVSYGRGDAAVGTTTLDGGSLATVPIESFVDQAVSEASSVAEAVQRLSIGLSLSI